MRLADVVRTASAPGQQATDVRWLAVGTAASRALAAAVDDATRRVRSVADIHRALEVLDSDAFTGCVVDPRHLGARPDAALSLLGRRLPARPVIVLDAHTSPELRRVVEQRGALLCTPGPPRRRSAVRTRPGRALPRADEAPRATDTPSPGHFAAGCLARAPDVEDLLEFVLDTFTAGAGATRVSLMLLDETRQRLLVTRAVGLDPALVGRAYSPLGRGIAGKAALLGRPRRGRAAVGGSRGYASSAFLVLPLLAQTGACVGVVNLTGFHDDQPPDGAALRRWIQLARFAGHALGTAGRLARAEALVATDDLTGLANRRAFSAALDREVERAGRTGTALAVALLDIDHFKRVNDTYGHPVGDRVLVHVARTLEHAFRDSDLVARWGGEEFSALLPATGPAPPDAALAALERARVRLAARPLDRGPDRPELRVTLSGGIAFYGGDLRDGPALVRAADRALYDAKEAGRNAIRRA